MHKHNTCLRLMFWFERHYFLSIARSNSLGETISYFIFQHYIRPYAPNVGNWNYVRLLCAVATCYSNVIKTNIICNDPPSADFVTWPISLIGFFSHSLDLYIIWIMRTVGLMFCSQRTKRVNGCYVFSLYSTYCLKHFNNLDTVKYTRITYIRPLCRA